MATPTATATPISLSLLGQVYENDLYGLTLRFPVAWQEILGVSNDPVVTIVGPQGLPTIYASIRYQLEPTPLEDAATTYLEQIGPIVGGTTVETEGAISLVDGTPAYEVVFLSGNGLKLKLVFVTRGTQQVELLAFSLPDNFDSRLADINGVLYSFQFREPIPYGVPRSQSLVLADFGPLTLDPHLVRDVGSAMYVVHIFGGLVTLDRDLQPVPDLAERWDVSDDGRVYTFYLRQDVTFHDGTPVTAQDFKYSLERAADPATRSPTASLYLDDIVGVKEKLAGTAQEISGVRVLGDYTLEITIDARKAFFLAKLTYPTAFVLDRENVESGALWFLDSNGTGPFKLKVWDLNEILILERFEEFYGLPAKMPYIGFRLLRGISIDMYEDGEIDVAYVGADNLDRALDPKKGWPTS